MDHIIQDINELCSKDIHLCFADNKVRLSRAFYHVLGMDGAEVAAALLCDVNRIRCHGKGKPHLFDPTHCEDKCTQGIGCG
jgi:hypothetical protein